MNIQPISNAVAQGARASQTTDTVVSVAPPVNPAQAQSPIPQPDSAQLTQAVSSINEAMKKLAPGLEFSIDQESNRTIVKVVDQQTKELIRQMPSAETLEIAKALDRVQGLLISLSA